MKIPRELVIGESIWRVRFVREPGDYYEPKCKDLLGLCDPSAHTLYIRSHLRKKQRVETFIHELIHALEYIYSERWPSLTRMLNHNLIEKLEGPIADLILENLIGR